MFNFIFYVLTSSILSFIFFKPCMLETFLYDEKIKVMSEKKKKEKPISKNN